MLRTALLLLPLSLLTACQPAQSQLSAEDKAIAEAKGFVPNPEWSQRPPYRLARAGEPDFVPEPIAQSVLSQLPSWGKDGDALSQGLRECAALREANARSDNSCMQDGSDELEAKCMARKGFGKKSVGQSLKAYRVDLNADGTPDYILFDRYGCAAQTANQADVYFVMLSQQGGGFRLAYAGWASFGLQLVRRPDADTPVLVERAYKSYGTFTRILHLVDGRYAVRRCIVEDEKGLSSCDNP